MAIKDQYVSKTTYLNKTVEQVWDEWLPSQRNHFIEDHYFCEKGLKQRKTADLQKISYGETLKKYIGHKWNAIPDVPVKSSLYSELYNHIEGGQYGKGGGVEEEVYIDFLNKEKNFRQDRKYFKGKDAYQQAVKWAKKNFERFDRDMIKYKMAGGGIIASISSFLNQTVTLNDFKI